MIKNSIFGIKNGFVDELCIALRHYEGDKNASIIKVPIKFEDIREALKYKKN